MGCLFSSPSSDDQGDRHRKVDPLEESLLPNGAIKSTTTTTEPQSMALNMNNKPNQQLPTNTTTFTPRLLGASYTDKAQREKQNFNNIVHQARKAFINISNHHQPQVLQLSHQALQLTAHGEQLLSHTPVENLPNGFFERKIPQSMITSIDPNPDSTADNGIANIMDIILCQPDLGAVQVAFACAQETCFALAQGAIPKIPNSLVITREEFKEFNE